MAVTAEIISIGTELLMGQIVDTDAAYLGRELPGFGVSVYRRGTVGDNFGRAVEMVRQAKERADIVFLIGGLGPTQDDLTRDVIADVFEAPLVRDETIVAHLTDWFGKRNYPMPPSILRQADVPTGGVALPNVNGTAPGLLLEKNGKTVIALPGPPNEFVPLFESEVAAYLRHRLGTDRDVIRSRTLRVVGMGESRIEELLQDVMEGSNPTVAPYAKVSEVHLRVTARANNEAEADTHIDSIVRTIYERLGSALYGENDTTLEAATVALLKNKRATVATAESCTGGLLGGRLTEVAGSSEVYGVGLVTYSNEAKQNLLQIPHALIAQMGAVSGEVAMAMAERVREISGATYGIGITGIAGPGGGTEQKPVGLVYVALSGPSGTKVERNLFTGIRADIRLRSTQKALDLLRLELLAQ